MLTDINRGAEAVELLHRAVGLEPDDDRMWCQLARAELSCGRARAALPAVNRALALDPAQEWAHRLASIALSQLDDHEGAVRAARESVRLAPHTWQALVQLAEALSEHPAGRSAAGPLHAEARWAAGRAIELAPLEPEPHTSMGHVLLAHADAHWAAQAFHEALRLNPNDARALNGLGLANLRRGDLASAAGDFGAAAGADPHDDVARRNISAAAWNAARTLTWLLLAMAFVLMQAIQLPWLVARCAAVLICLVAGCLLGVRTWRQVPRSMHRYLRRLPLREPLLGATLTLAITSVLLLTSAAVPADLDIRSSLGAAGFLTTLATGLVRWAGVSLHNRAVERGSRPAA